MVAPFVVPAIMGATSLIGGAMGGKGGKGGSGSAGYPPELNKILGLQYDTMKNFQPMTNEWARMGNAYMGIPTIGGTGSMNLSGIERVSPPFGALAGSVVEQMGRGGRFGGNMSSPYANPRSLASNGGVASMQGQSAGAPATGVGGGAPMELEAMPALRDLLFQPGGTNELLMRRQGATARDQILETLPTGGVQQMAMANQRRGENENLAAMRVDARRGAANTVLGGGPMINQSLAMGQAAGGTAGMAANAYGQQQAAKGAGLGGLGQMIGTGLGSYFGGKG